MSSEISLRPKFIKLTVSRSYRITGPRKHGFSLWNFFAVMSTSRDISSSGLEAAVLDFPFTVWFYSIPTIPTEKLDLEKVGLAIEISFISLPQAEI
jgi:hypothetical protein